MKLSDDVPRTYLRPGLLCNLGNRRNLVGTSWDPRNRRVVSRYGAQPSIRAMVQTIRDRLHPQPSSAPPGTLYELSLDRDLSPEIRIGQVDDCSYWLMYQPPFGEITWPVMNFASSLAR